MEREVEEERKRREAMEKRMEEQEKALGDARKEAEEARKKEEEARVEAEEAKKKEEAARKEAEDARKEAEEAKRKEAEAKKEGEELRSAVEEARRKEEEARKRADALALEQVVYPSCLQKSHQEEMVKEVASGKQDGEKLQEVASPLSSYAMSGSERGCGQGRRVWIGSHDVGCRERRISTHDVGIERGYGLGYAMSDAERGCVQTPYTNPGEQGAGGHQAA
eukprot:3837669-Rhodomonas_salina.1